MNAATETNPAALTVETVKAFAHDPKTKNLQINVYVARAHAETIREHVDGYLNAELQAGGWEFFESRSDRCSGELITHHDRLWLSDDDAQNARWDARTHVLHAENGYLISDDKCPALVAESDLMDAERALLEHGCAAFAATGMTFERVNRNMDHRKKVLELWMKA